MLEQAIAKAMGLVMLFMLRSVFWLGLVFSTMDWSGGSLSQDLGKDLGKDLTASAQSAMTRAVESTSSTCSSDMQACALVLTRAQLIGTGVSEALNANRPEASLPAASAKSTSTSTPPKPEAHKHPSPAGKSEKLKSAHLDQGLQKVSLEKVSLEKPSGKRTAKLNLANGKQLIL